MSATGSTWWKAPRPKPLQEKEKAKTCIEMRSPPQPALSFPYFVTVPNTHADTRTIPPPVPTHPLFLRIIRSDPSCVRYCAARGVRCFDDDDAPFI